MATEKDKTIRELCERYKDDDLDSCADFAREVWDAARADAIEECAQFVDDYDYIETYGGYYNNDDARATLMKCAVAIRKLSEERKVL